MPLYISSFLANNNIVDSADDYGVHGKSYILFIVITVLMIFCFALYPSTDDD